MKSKLTFSLILCILFLSACTKTKIKTKNNAEQKKDIIETISIETALLYKPLYDKAQKTKSNFFPYDIELSRNDINYIEEFLGENNVPIIDTDEIYPEYLKNSEDFLELKNSGFPIDKPIYFAKISKNGSLVTTFFENKNKKISKTTITTSFSDNKEPQIISKDTYDVLDWEISASDFYYKTSLQGVPYDDYVNIKLKNIDKNLYDFNLKYIIPIGYTGNNMFVTEWESPNYDNISFNDTLEYFYKTNTGGIFDTSLYEKVRKPEVYYNIPADLFENTVMPYFEISLSEFRKKSLYDNGIYPYVETGGGNLSTYPSMESEVVKYTKNSEDIFTLTVNVRCNEYKTSMLFTHEVTIKNTGNEKFKYLKNKIIYKSNFVFPPNKPRMKEQQK